MKRYGKFLTRFLAILSLTISAAFAARGKPKGSL